MQAYETLVLENNGELAGLHEQLGELRETYSKIFLLSDTGITVTGSYAYNPAITGNGAHNVSGSASLQIPVLPQVSVHLQASSSGNATASVSLNPFASLGSSLALEQQIASVELAIVYKRLQLQWQSRISLLQYATARTRLNVLASVIENKRLQFEESERQFDAGFISAGELRSAADAFATASSGHIASMLDEANAEKSLYVLADVDDIPHDLVTFDINAEVLQTLVSEAHEAYRDISSVLEFTTQSRQSLLLQKQFLERQIRTTWPVEPGVSVSLSGAIQDVFDSAAPTAGAIVSLQLSAGSFHFDEIRDLPDDLSAVEHDLLVDGITGSIDEANQKRSLRSSQLAVETAVRSLEGAHEAAEQALRDFERHEISEFEYREAHHDRDLATVGYLSALIGVYGQVGTLLRSYTVTHLNQE